MGRELDPAAVVVVLVAWMGGCFLVGRLAVGYGREFGVWVLIALLTSPLLAFVLLQFAGDADRARDLAAAEDDLRRRHPALRHVREAAVNETHCPTCRAAVNPITRDGLHSPDAEPWLLLCDTCGSPGLTTDH
jgi:hypothetical protein